MQRRRRALYIYNLRIAGCYYFQPEKEDKSTTTKKRDTCIWLDWIKNKNKEGVNFNKKGYKDG